MRHDLVVLLRGVNVGGHRSFRPRVLANELKRLDVVNVGAAGTFVVRRRVSQKELRAELRRRLPFETEVMICSAKDVLRFAASDPFAGEPSRRDIVPFVSVLAKRRRPPVALPLSFPTTDEWGVKVLGVQDRFVFGLYRRQMKAIGYLGKLDRIFGVPMTTRNWNTISAIVRILQGHDAT